MEAKEIESLVGDLETNIDRLRSLYEQYFMGIERIAPSVVHKDVERRIYALRKEQIRNTAIRFRFQMIIQRYNTYQTHWQRVCRQIEEGTYKRDIIRAHRKLAPPVATTQPAEPEDDLVPSSSTEPNRSLPPLAFQKLELDDIDAFSNLDLSGAIPPAKPPPLPKKPPPLPPQALVSDTRLRQIYAQYVATRERTKEATPLLSYDALAKNLRDSTARLRDKHGSVDFEVAVKEGKTILRVITKPKR